MIGWTWLVLVSFVSLIWLIIHLWSNRRFYELARKIPQVSGNWPLIGHLPFHMGQSPKEQYVINMTSTGPGPSPRKYWLGPVLFVVVDDPDQLQILLTSKYSIDKPFFYDALFFKKGLLVSNGGLWRAHRKLCDPAFNLNILRSFLPIFNEKSQILLKVLDKKVGGKEFNMFDMMAPYALDNIMSTSMGLEANAQENNSSELLKHCSEGLRVSAAKLLNHWLQIPLVFRFTEFYKVEQEHIINGFMKMANNVLVQKEKDFQDGTFVEDSRKPQIFIDQLFKKRDVFTNDEISDEVNTIIAAGFDTISNTLSMISLLLAFYPEVQEKVFKELQEVFDTQDEEVNDEKIDKLIYTTLVIKEVMRFWPPTGFIGRYLNKDLQLGDKIVPAGANFFIPIVQVHRDKRLWGEDADKFRPERFLPEEHSKVHTYAYFPFSRGPRNCIGYRYAMKSMKVAMSYLFRRYKFSTAMIMDEIEFEYLITSKVAQGYNVTIEHRNFENIK